jgi:hypothetical protein
MTTLPNLSPHGTSPETILAYATQATDALEGARAAMHLVGPNCRDYSPQQFPAAVNEWSRHYEAVLAAIRFVREHAEHAADAA